MKHARNTEKGKWCSSPCSVRVSSVAHSLLEGQFQPEAGTIHRLAAEREPAAKQAGPALRQRQSQTNAARRHVRPPAAAEGAEDRPPFEGWHAGAAVF